MTEQREIAGHYEVVITDAQEHLVPDGERHDPASTCACGPLQARNVRGGSGLPTWLHRALAPA